MTESFEDYINHSLDWLTYQTDTTEVESGKQEKAGVDAAKKRQAAWQNSALEIEGSEEATASAVARTWYDTGVSIMNWLSSVGQWTVDWGKWLVTSLYDFFYWLGKKVVDLIPDWVWDLLGFSGGGVVEAKAFGGIVAGGIQAMAGGGGSQLATVLAGEEGPELAVTPDSRAMLLGSGGPGLYTLPVGTEISTAAETSNLRLSNVPRMAGGGSVSNSSTSNAVTLNVSFPNLTIREEADIDKISDRIAQRIPMALSMVLS